MTDRIKELDYLKAIFITLMVIFHLVYIGDSYPHLKAVVYSFHMPAFLIISGYLANVAKETKPFLRGVMWLFIPYALLELCYAVASFYMPVRDGLTELSAWSLVEKLLLSPIGPYWYIHTLIICTVIYYFVARTKLTPLWQLMMLLVGYGAMAYLELVSLSNALYFLVGAALAMNAKRFTTLFRSSWLALIPLIILCWYPQNLSLAKPIIVYLAICSTLWLHNITPNGVRRFLYFIGTNTLIILLFSPIFTATAKPMVQLFSFDSTGILFMVVATSMAIGGSLAIAWVMDTMRLTPIIFGRARVLNPPLRD